MILEYIVEDSKYKELLVGKISERGKKGPIRVTSKKFSGVNNYVLTIEYKSSPVESAETLSKIFRDIKEIFDSNKVKYYILRNEAAIEFANRLYPFVCEFETKLRKFLYVALFDLDEAAKQLAANKIKTAGNKLSKIEKIPQGNFLEELTLGEVFILLFDNRDFLDAAKTETKQIESTLGRKTTKKELIAIIEKIEEKTLWNELFQPIFGSFSLPTAQNELFGIRNDVMHFHFISYEQYKRSLELLKKINKELDGQLDKRIVLENNKENAEVVSNNYRYTFRALYAMLENIQEQMSVAVMSSMTPVISALTAIQQSLPVAPALDITNNLYTTLAALYKFNGMDGLLEEPQKESEGPAESEKDEGFGKVETPEEQED